MVIFVLKSAHPFQVEISVERERVEIAFGAGEPTPLVISIKAIFIPSAVALS
jgi:hypothetical protein